MQLQVQLLHKDAKLPTFAHDSDAGMDLFSVEEITIKPGQRAQVSVGIALAIPVGSVGLIWDKSGISHKAGLKTLGGVIDSGYRGEVVVGFVNTSDSPHSFAVGDKVAQLLIQKVEHPSVQEVDILNETQRGKGAFGSTGI
jgi:dUTP pyrophosphatase